MRLTRFRPAIRDRRVGLGEERACPGFKLSYLRSVDDVTDPAHEGVFGAGVSLCR